MRINTEHSLKLAKYLYKRYGSWQAIRQNSKYENGVYIINKPYAGDEIGSIVTE